VDRARCRPKKIFFFTMGIAWQQAILFWLGTGTDAEFHSGEVNFFFFTRPLRPEVLLEISGLGGRHARKLFEARKPELFLCTRSESHFLVEAP
jgi:hypothetical protein